MPGPVKVLVSKPLYSHDHQHVIIPEGTIALGEAKKIGAAGFGQQRRMAVVFHRLIMPDGYTVDLDQFHGLEQIGQEGTKDKVNNHYLQIFGTSIALGVIAGASEITQGGGTIVASGSQAFTNGAAASISQSAATILDRFMQIPPTITIREGHRVKVYFTQDLLLPAYSTTLFRRRFRRLSNANRCPLPVIPVDSHPCRLREQSGKSEEVAGPIQRRIPGLCQGLPGRRHDLRSRKNANRREADQGTDGGSRSQEEGTRRTVQASRPTILRSSRKRFSLHSSKAVPL